MSFVCSVIALEWATKGDIITAIIAFCTGIIIDAIIIYKLETLATMEGVEE